MLALPTVSGKIQHEKKTIKKSVRLGKNSQTHTLDRRATCKAINVRGTTTNKENKLDGSSQFNLPENQLNASLDCLYMICQVTQKGGEGRNKAVTLNSSGINPAGRTYSVLGIVLPESHWNGRGTRGTGGTLMTKKLRKSDLWVKSQIPQGLKRHGISQQILGFLGWESIQTKADGMKNWDMTIWDKTIRREKKPKPKTPPNNNNNKKNKPKKPNKLEREK